MKRFLSIIILSAVILTFVFSLCSYTYVVDYTISYVNENGDEIADKVTGSVDATSPDMAVASPTIDGFALLDDNDIVVFYDMLAIDYPPSHYDRRATGTYTVVYTRVYTVSVRYIFNDTSKAADTKTVTGKKGSTYSVVSPDVEGYSPNRPSVNGNFTMNNTIYVIYYPDNYSIRFDANGGSGAPSPITKYYGTPLTLPSSSPQRTGYMFSGWSMTKYGNTEYLPGDTYSREGNATLYAVWETDPDYHSPSVTTKPEVTTTTKDINEGPVNTTTEPPQTQAETEPSEPHYTVQYNANGGVGGPGVQYKIHGKTLILSNNRPTRSGYRFLGWNENKYAGSPTYYSGGNYTKNSGTTLYAIWEKSTSYSITYTCILLSVDERVESYPIGSYAQIIDIWTTAPDEAGFMGWATEQFAKEPEYYPGDEIYMDSDKTLYALWDYMPYDLVVMDLSLEPNECMKGTTVNGSFKVKCNNFRVVVPDISIDIKIDNTTLKTISFTFNDQRTYLITFTIDTSSLEGNKTVSVVLDKERKADEADTVNNTLSASLKINTVSPIPEENYDSSSPVSCLVISEKDAISSFVFSSSINVKPIDSIKANFEVWTKNGEEKTSIYTATKNNIVVPEHEQNLIYFKWTVPSGYSNKQVFATCTFTKGQSVLSVSTSKLNIMDVTESRTKDTEFSTGKLTLPSAPDITNSSLSWYIWEFTNGSFVKKEYLLDYSSSSLSIAPGQGVLYSINDKGEYVIKSGYGISAIATINSSSVIPQDMLSDPEYCRLFYPEYSYSQKTNEYDLMEKTSESTFCLKQNPDSENNSRIHFTPIQTPDGDYVVTLKYLVFTPKGEFYVELKSNSIEICSDAYKDWYYGNK